MKTVNTMAAQGDVLFRRVYAVPKNATVSSDKGPIVVAHSETGHHHAIDDAGVVRFEVGDPLICYLQLSSESCDVVHHRPYDTHETLRLVGPGVFEVRRQREYAPPAREEYRRSAPSSAPSDESWRLVDD